jgi:Cdc6-like AAA superfamily ATPase
MPPSSPIPPAHRFSADRPLDFLCDDRLERKGFVERLATDLLGWHGNDSLVISLNGEWGSGKTTLKNFLKERLHALGKPLIVEFNPWQWSGQDRVFEAFFAAIRAKFETTDASAQTEKLADRWEAFAAWTKLGATISAKLDQAVTPLLGTSITGALLANSANAPGIRVTGIVLGIIGILLSSFIAIFPEIAAHVVECARAKLGRQKMTLEDLRADITAQLEKLRKEGRPVVVIIDDIDRLTKDEIRRLFQLVKANADFPNLVYLLLFQKDIVASALSQVVADRGGEYLKKVVQVEFDVPLSSRKRMLKIFQEDFDRIVGRSKPKMYWDKSRIQHLFEDYLWPYFRTLRDVKRFIGTFDFYFNGHVNGGVLEVNPIDHEAYVIVRDSFGYGSEADMFRSLLGDDDQAKQVNAQIEGLTKRARMSEDEKGRLNAILRSLFPEDKPDGAQHEHDLRICHPDHFHKYFEHALDESPTSAGNVHALIAMLGDRKAFATRLREVCQTGELEDVLSKLDVYLKDVPPGVAPEFVTALLDVSDQFPEERPGMLNSDPIYSASRMIFFLLKKLPNQDDRAKILRDAITSSIGSVLPVAVVRFIEPKKGDNAEQILLDEARLATIRAPALVKLEAMAKSGKIWESRIFARLVNSWRKWAGDDPVRQWLEPELATPARRLDFLSRYTGATTSGSEVVSYSLPATWLEGVINLEETAKLVSGLELKTPREKAAVELLTRAIQCKTTGQPYEHLEINADE